MRILFLTARLPYPPTRGDRLRAYNFLRELSREHEITLLSFIGHEAETAHVAQLQPYCRNVHLIHRTQWQSAATTAISAWRRLPLQTLYYRSAVMRSAVNELLAGQRFDAVYVHLFRMAQYVDQWSAPYRILDLTDAISQEIARSLPYRSRLWRTVYRNELPRVQRYELDIASRFDETWLISAADKQALAAAGARGRLEVVPNGVDTERFHWEGRPVIEPSIAFVGHMGVPHNIDAANYLARELLPLIRESVPGTQLRIIGAEPAASVRQLDELPGVQVLGHVADLNAALNRSAVFVAPLRFAAGVQNKVLEAMAAELPVVTTRYVNEGLEAEPGRHLFLGEDAVELAAASVALLRDAGMRRSMGAAAREHVLARFRWEMVSERMRAIAGQLRSNR